MPLSESDVLSADKLPTSNLSCYLESRLDRSLKKEREDRAKISGVAENMVIFYYFYLNFILYDTVQLSL